MPHRPTGPHTRDQGSAVRRAWWEGGTIVVPLDGSVEACLALRPAAALAARSGSDLLAVTARPFDGGTGKEAETLLRQVGPFAGVVPVSSEVVHGPPADAILRVASRPRTLVCMAHHRRGVGRLLHDSVTEEVVGRSEEPVVLVGRRCRTALLPGERGRLLVCHDGSPTADVVLHPAAELAEVLHLEVWLVQVVAPVEEVRACPDDGSRTMREAEDALDQVRSHFIGRGVPIRIRAVHGHDAARSIARFAERLPAALIAITTHGPTGLARIARGSLTFRTLDRAPCPVLVARSDSG